MTIQKPPSQMGCTWVAECIEMCSATSVYVEEHGIRATFRNQRGRQIRKLHYDSCYHKAEQGRSADFILSLMTRIDVLIELKGTDRNLTGESGAYGQIESTLQLWMSDPLRSPKIGALIIHGRIEAKKKLPGRIPRAVAEKTALEARFIKKYRVLLLIRENGERQFTFNDFLRKRDVR